MPDIEVKDVIYHAGHDDAEAFRKFVERIKQKYAHGRLGVALDRSKHLEEFNNIVGSFRSLADIIQKALGSENVTDRDLLRASIPTNELVSFSNMCIALTTKDNVKLYRKLQPDKPFSNLNTFTGLYLEFKKLLSKESDVERARLRRLIPAEVFARMSDAISSLRDENSVQDYKARQKFSFKL